MQKADSTLTVVHEKVQRNQNISSSFRHLLALWTLKLQHVHFLSVYKIAIFFVECLLFFVDENLFLSMQYFYWEILWIWFRLSVIFTAWCIFTRFQFDVVPRKKNWTCDLSSSTLRSTFALLRLSDSIKKNILWMEIQQKSWIPKMNFCTSQSHLISRRIN